MATPVGFDPGNSWTKICLQGKYAKIPSRYAFECPPGPIGKGGQELRPKAFKSLFEDMPLWFGLDTLSIGGVQKLDMAKYDANHISILFRAALYQWGKSHKVDIESLGRLNIVGSMPPGLYQKPNLNKQALNAFRKAFNRGQSHVKIRDGKDTVQIVTHFDGMIREAVAWGKVAPRQNELVLVVDLGGGTNDYVIFNGAPEPLKTFTDNSGLLHTYSQIDPLNLGEAELKVLKQKKKLPSALVVYYNEAERRIQLISRRLPRAVDRLYIIGGGAALMPPSIKSVFTSLATKVVIKNEYTNAEANWRHAGGEDGN
jgi:hypothetical protein